MRPQSSLFRPPLTLLALLIGLVGAMASLTIAHGANNGANNSTSATNSMSDKMGDKDLSAYATAIFAGGCFWCVEADFEKLDGVVEAVSGYSGGDLENPTYDQVSHTNSGHLEVAIIYYDPSVVSYRQLVNYFFHHIDPYDSRGQFCDKGPSYKTAVFVANAKERAIAKAVKTALEDQQGKDFYTPIRDRKTFWPAEDYHQDYYKKNPRRYSSYRAGCGRDARIRRIWGKH